MRVGQVFIIGEMPSETGFRRHFCGGFPLRSAVQATYQNM
ncbi:hypothetical protein NMA510612_0638 [Neisseria meningitidis]|uniref:Uncharacterized protein n=1 Tax=Neisseria meningitidis TaxID=487 RepID=X5F4R2_NEIME|nr:hypothetical protein NMA510612_0638 [Neisseria meningitidis]